jgi:hypothetical protein
MDTLQIISAVSLAVYDVVGIVVLVWAICAIRKLPKGRC